eukprot:SAG11_NODE_30683_length_298_cov_1.552764_1_plen_55_part_10
MGLVLSQVYAIQFFAELVSTLSALCTERTRVLLVNERRWRDVDRWFAEELGKEFD